VSSFLVEVAVAEDDAPAPGLGERGEVGPLSAMSESGDLGPAPGWGVPPLLVVLRSCGDPTLLSVYLQVAARLLWVRGAGVRAGAEGGGLRRACPAEEERVAEDEGGV
jgi:hypothetical protein